MPGNFTQWTPAAAIELMDRCNIATGITSLNAPGVVGSDLQKDRALARDCNEFAAQMTRDHPKRFGAFAAIPALDVEGSLREMAYALDTLHADGIGLMTSYGTTYLGSNHFLPILEELNRRKAVLFVHPAIPQFGQAFDPPVQPSYLEMPFDTARTIMSLLLNGAFTRFADIRFIFSHGGGGLPLLYRRIDYIFGADEKLRERFPNGLMAALRNVHFEMTNVLDGASYAMLRQLYRLDRMLFGTDNPAMPASVNAEYFDRLQMSDAERRAIGRENALKLFPRFA